MTDQNSHTFRRRIVDVLEHVYGPLGLSLVFSIFLALADPAHEVMLIFADDILNLPWTYLGAGFIGLGIGLFFVFVVGRLRNRLFRRLRKQLEEPEGKNNSQSIKERIFEVLRFFLMNESEGETEDRPFMFFLLGFFGSSGVLYFFGDGDGSTLNSLIVMLTDDGFTSDQIDQISAQITATARVTFGITSFFFVPVLLFLTTVLAIQSMDEKPGFRLQRGLLYKSDPIGQFFIDWTGRLPLLAAALGMVSVVASDEGSPAHDRVLIALAFLCLLAAGLRVLGPIYRRFLSRPAWSINKIMTEKSVEVAPFSLGLATAYIFAQWSDISIAVVAGPIGIASVFVIVASVFLAYLTLLSKRLTRAHFPLWILLVVATMIASGSANAFTGAIVFALMLLLIVFFYRSVALNYRIGFGLIAGVAVAVGYLQSRSEQCPHFAGCNIMQGADLAPESERPTHRDVPSAVTAWLGKRTVALPQMTIVAAQGGGLFAGYHAAYDLATRADISRNRGESPPFAETVFAISGVSGGSVGAAAFWAVQQSGICQGPNVADDCYRDAIRKILRRDYLSSSLSGLLFRDNLDTVLPYFVSLLSDKPTDRGAVLEDRFASVVSQVVSGGSGRLLDTSLQDSWRADGKVPLLFLNATDMDDGNRVIQSPLRAFEDGNIADFSPSRASIRNFEGEERDLTVVNAAILSARFPIVTPPGRYHECKDKSCTTFELKQIADGGYFDNTGLETVSDILAAMTTSDTPMPSIDVLSYSILEPPSDREIRGTLGAPLNGIVAATTARRSLTRQRFCAQWADHPGLKVTPLHVRLDLRPSALSALSEETGATLVANNNYTLSWILADSTFGMIEAQVEQTHAHRTPICAEPKEPAGNK